jgi:hypothetical protein
LRVSTKGTGQVSPLQSTFISAISHHLHTNLQVAL